MPELPAFETYLRDTRPLVDGAISTDLTSGESYVRSVNPLLNPIYKSWQDSFRGGKRLRGVFVILGYQIANPSASRSEILESGIANAAAGVENLQTALVVQDDIMDESLKRRNRPSLHADIGGHRGISHAICLSDWGIAALNSLILETNFPDMEKLQAVSLSADIIKDTALGQMVDIELSPLREGTRVEDVVEMYRLKTALYSFVYPLQLGAVLGSGDPWALEGIRRYGENLGISYQIKDDELGMFGDEAETGKPVRTDASEGKPTILALNAFKGANPLQKHLLESLYGKRDLTQEELDTLREIFSQTKALDFSRREQQIYSRRAKNAIPEVTINRRYQEILGQAVDSLAGRIN